MQECPKHHDHDLCSTANSAITYKFVHDMVLHQFDPLVVAAVQSCLMHSHLEYIHQMAGLGVVDLETQSLL